MKYILLFSAFLVGCTSKPSLSDEELFRRAEIFCSCNGGIKSVFSYTTYADVYCKDGTYTSSIELVKSACGKIVVKNDQSE